MTKFYVEFRLHGFAKTYAKKLIWRIAQRFRVLGAIGDKVVPHIGLYGQAETTDIRKVIGAIKRVGRKYRLVPFQIKGFGAFDKAHKVIYLNIVPSDEMIKLRHELSTELRKVSICKIFDKQDGFQFHATVAFKDINDEFEKIQTFLEKKREPYINQHLLRITVVGSRRRIKGEYDLILQRWLTRRESLSTYQLRKTMHKLRELLVVEALRDKKTKGKPLNPARQCPIINKRD